MGRRSKTVRLSLVAVALGVGLAWAPSFGQAEARTETRADACAVDTVLLRGDWGEARFSVAVADDDDERAQGLMHVETLARSAGMLFVYEGERPVRFWMRNTLIPLDMIFADATGTVQKVHVNAQPLSERLIHGGDNIQYVLEVNGGVAEQLGIDAGSQLRHPAIAAARAAWPC